MKHAALALTILAAALPAAAQDYTDGRIRYVEGGATLQRASEPGSEEAFRNLPFLPGDRVWTDETGRVEFDFGGGVIVRLAERSKLDYVEHPDDGPVVLRLWSGALSLHGRDQRGAPGLQIETPGGLVDARGNAEVRVDVGFGETRVAVFEGQAGLDNGRRRVTAEAGEETRVRPGEDPERPTPLERREADAFARWDAERERQIDWAAEDSRYLPEEVAPYAPDLEGHGSWHFDVQIGYVWRPFVSAGWRPYTFGRWVWSPYGWTWVPNEAWGWAPFHYGRWGQSSALGWYWIPGSTWGPAWVSWSVGRDYVGWCPLGRGDRPLVVDDSRILGFAVARGSQASPWTYTRRADLTARDGARRRGDVPETELQTLRIVDRNAHLDRHGDVAAGPRAVPRHVQVRPTPGDTIPELRANPLTTIPFPVARRRYPSEDERRERDGHDRSPVRYEQARPADAPATAPPASDPGARRRQRDDEVRTAPRGLEPFSWVERRRATSASDQPAARPTAGAGDGEQARERVIDRTQDRDVLRRVFGPLSGVRSRDAGESRPTSRDDAARSRGRETPREGASARPERPQGPPRDDAARRKKDP